jgi:hypothetical protein
MENTYGHENQIPEKLKLSLLSHEKQCGLSIKASDQTVSLSSLDAFTCLARIKVTVGGTWFGIALP